MLEQAPSNAAPRCLFCDQPKRAEIFEVWGHEFMLTACCEGLHEQIVADMNDDPKWARDFVRSIGIEHLCGYTLRRVGDDGCCGLVLDWQLRLKPIATDTVRRFIARYHTHCGVPVTWRFHNAVFNGATLIGVAVVGNPVAPALQSKRGILEVVTTGFLRTPRHACGPPLERRLHALRLVRARSRKTRLGQDHHLYTRGRGRHLARGGRLETRGDRAWPRLAQLPPAPLQPQQLDRQGALEPDLRIPQVANAKSPEEHAAMRCIYVDRMDGGRIRVRNL